MPIASVSKYYLKDEEVQLCKQESLNGVSDASFKLYKYYEFVKLDVDEAMKWLLRAAESNHPLAQYNLALHYDIQGNTRDAVKWATAALSNGMDRAQEIIDKK